jgi:hypothetical protein
MEWRIHRPRNAEEAFRAAAKICPGFPEAEGNLGLVLEERGSSAESKERLLVALQGDPLAAKARSRLDRRTGEE